MKVFFIYVIYAIACIGIVISFRTSYWNHLFQRPRTISNSKAFSNRIARRKIEWFLFSTNTKLSFNKYGIGIRDESVEESPAAVNESLQSVEKILDVRELNEKWIDVCIDESRPQDLNSYSLAKVLPYVIDQWHTIQLVNSSSEQLSVQDIPETFITEKELLNIWLLNSNLPFGKKAESFTAKDALLLIEDEEEKDIMGDSSLESTNLATKSTIESDEVLGLEDPEFIITTQVSSVIYAVENSHSDTTNNKYCYFI